MKILYLCIYNSNEYYDKMFELQQKHIPNLFYYVTFKKLSVDYIIENNVIYINGEETYVPGILVKTMKAIEILKGISFDFLIRTNISTVLNFKKIQNYLETFDKNDVLYIGQENTLNWLFPEAGVVDTTYFGTKYHEGICIIFSKKLIEVLIKQNINYSLIDDLSLGLCINSIPYVKKICLHSKFCYNNIDFNLNYFAYANNQNKQNRNIDVSNLEYQIHQLTKNYIIENKTRILYRISNNSYHKLKPEYLNKESTLWNFLKIFHNFDIYIIADNVNEELYSFLIKLKNVKIIRTYLSNAGAFMFAAKYAIDNFNENDIVYFAEDDYMYTQNAPQIIFEGLDIADYSSGYDHPDKYNKGDNPLITKNGEDTVLMKTNNSHWKYTNSTCMTFATKVKTIKEDYSVYNLYCNGTHPNDFSMFRDLITHGRKLITSVPGVSTHGVTGYFSPFIDWEKEFLKEKYTIVIPINPSGNDEQIQLFLESLKYVFLPDVHKIYIITSINKINVIKQFEKNKNFDFIDQETIEPSGKVENWIYQQILKLKIAKIIKTKYYLIIDDDMFLLKELTYSDLFYNKRIIYSYEKYPHYNPPGYTNTCWWESSCKMLNYPVEKLYNLTNLMSATPQVLITEIVLEILDLNLHFNYFTEFTLYWIYIIKTEREHLYTTHGNKLLDVDENVNVLCYNDDIENIITRACKEKKYHFLLFQSNLKIFDKYLPFLKTHIRFIS